MIIVPTLSPGLLMKSSGDDHAGQVKFFETVLDDFRKAKRLTTSRPTWDESAIWKRDSTGRPVALFPTVADVVAFFIAARGHLVAVDVETTGESPLACQLICVGFCTDTGDVLCVPFLRQGGTRYWHPADEMNIFDLLRAFMADWATPKLFHNGSFDCCVLFGQGFPVGNWAHDTMAAHHVVDSELPHGLAFLGSRYLDIRYWKDDVKGGTGWLDLDDEILRSYNLRDCIVTMHCHAVMQREVKKAGLVKLYEDELKLNQIFTRATVRGIAVDFERRDSMQPELDKKTGQPTGRPKGFGPQLRQQEAAALATLQGIAGSPAFDPNKPVHLRYLLFDQLRFPVVKRSKSGDHPSTDKDALVLLALVADTPMQKAALRALIEQRSASKMLGTFVDGLPILGDGRFHPTWKLLTTSGRFASSPNAQNWPKKLKRIFRAGLGSKLVGVDLSQAELRFVTYLSDEPTLGAMYAAGVNVHTANVVVRLGVKLPPGHKDMDPATEAYCRKFLGDAAYNALPELPVSRVKTVRTLIKNDEFGRIYGAEDETVYKVLRSKRDVETNELLFPDIKLAEVEANGIKWKRELRTGIVSWWAKIQAEIQARGFSVCPISGRRRYFREGFKRNEMLNNPVQMGIASWMNKCTIEIQDTYDRETGGQCQIIQQVHDALNAEAPDGYERRAGEIMTEVLGRTFALPGHPNARLPPDPVQTGIYLDEV